MRVVSREARFVGLEQIMYEVIVVAGRSSSEAHGMGNSEAAAAAAA